MEIKAEGTKYFSDHTCGISWVLGGPTDESDSEIRESLGMVSHHGGPGYAFADRALVRRTPTRTLVTQRVGVDV